MGLLLYGVEFKDIYEVEVSLGGYKKTVTIPANSADEARALCRYSDGIEHTVWSVKGTYFDWPGKDQLPSLRRKSWDAILKD